MADIEAGRELDALIAQQIFGYTLDYEFADICDGPIVKELHDQYDEWGILPHYSTEMGDAWEIVGEMEQRGYWCQMRTPFQAPPDGDGHWAGFTPHGTSGWNGRPDHWTSAETLPLAICRAALCTQDATNG